MLAGTGRRGTRSRSSGCVRSDIRDGLPPSRLRFSAGPTGAPKRSRARTLEVGSTGKKTKHLRCFGWVPVGPAEKRRALRGRRRALSEHPQSTDCGCELRSRLRDRASQGSRTQCDRDRRGVLSLGTFFARAKKVPRRQAKNKSSKNKKSRIQSSLSRTPTSCRCLIHGHLQASYPGTAMPLCTAGRLAIARNQRFTFG